MRDDGMARVRSSTANDLAGFGRARYGGTAPATGGGRIAGLDGLRAIAVVGVLLFHAGVHWLPGGFLGVDLFFVISGFLITSLLIGERERVGFISFKAFYLRRARRLLPALIAMLVVTAGFMALFFPGDLASARGDIGAALSYVSNWWYVVHHRSYFVAAGRPEPLQHLWSLAVEEQFYLVWPLVLAALLCVRARLRLVVFVAVAGALASSGWMAVLAIRGNVPFDTDSSRVYFGTDTHASGLLLGAAAAAVMTGLANRRRAAGVAEGGLGRGLADLVAVGALVGVCWSMHSVSYFSPGLYRGGFLVFAAVAAVAVAVISAPGGWLGVTLDIAPLRWIGARSYGLYLWHWPVFVYTRPGLDWQLHGGPELAARLAITLALTELSYRLVEEPIRRRGSRDRVLSPRSRGARSWSPAWRIVAPALGSAVAIVAVIAATSVVASHAKTGAHAAAAGAPLAATSRGPQPAASAAVSAAPSSSTRSPLATSSWPTTASATTRVTSVRPTSGPHASSVGRPSTHLHASTAAPAGHGTPTPPPIPSGPPPKLTAVGDSVMVDASVSLGRVCAHTEVYAVVGWQAKSVFDELDALHAAGHLGQTVVIETGTNGVVSSKELDAALKMLADRHKVIVVNNHMDRPWEPANNAMFPVVVRAHRNAVVGNWDALANTHPDWLTTDGVHLTPAGRGPYANLIKTAAGC
jgi:peptidoglycan/LPS O-acetylase OafA/YrhL